MNEAGPGGAGGAASADGRTAANATDHARRDWLAVLSRAPRDSLAEHASRLPDAHDFEWLRAPETGLVMIRARIANQGDRFNMGEATVTRCVVRHRSPRPAEHVNAERVGYAGVGYVLGRDEERAAWVARFDALLQQPDHHGALMREVIEPLRAATESVRNAKRQATAASRVRFFTLQPEVNG
ncbi:phosphonate C-P lyase system protein PhnG [soil metagenome]